METVTIPKEEYERLKALGEELSLKEQLLSSLEDVKEGKVEKVSSNKNEFPDLVEQFENSLEDLKKGDVTEYN